MFNAPRTNSQRSFHAVARCELPLETLEQARFLIGRWVVRDSDSGIVAGRIVETEAYPPGDPAAHHYRRMTKRNRSLFLDRGRAYVYRAYGSCWMLNIGIALMAARRGVVSTRDLARGPGRLAAAFAIDRSLDGIDLCAAGPLYLALPADESIPEPTADIGVSVRIGITRATEAPWRFFIRGSRFVSGPTWLNAAGPAAGELTAPCRADPVSRM